MQYELGKLLFSRCQFFVASEVNEGISFDFLSIIFDYSTTLVIHSFFLDYVLFTSISISIIVFYDQCHPVGSCYYWRVKTEFIILISSN